MKLIILLLTAVSMASSAAPVLFFSDIESGPKTGGENGKGAYVCVFGKNFGSTRGTSTITVGGGLADNYPVWADEGPTSHRPASAHACFQLGANASTGNIVLTVDGVASNTLPFTVRAAGTSPDGIWCVDPSLGVSGDGHFPGGCKKLWKEVKDAGFAAGDIVYIKGAATTPESSTYYYLLPGGNENANMPQAFLGYPGMMDTVTIGDPDFDYSVLYIGTDTLHASNWVAANLSLVSNANRAVVRQFQGERVTKGYLGMHHNIRLVNIKAQAPRMDDSWTGAFEIMDGHHLKLYGLEATNIGCGFGKTGLADDSVIAQTWQLPCIPNTGIGTMTSSGTAVSLSGAMVSYLTTGTHLCYGTDCNTQRIINSWTRIDGSTATAVIDSAFPTDFASPTAVSFVNKSPFNMGHSMYPGGQVYDLDIGWFYDHHNTAFKGISQNPNYLDIGYVASTVPNSEPGTNAAKVTLVGTCSQPLAWPITGASWSGGTVTYQIDNKYYSGSQYFNSGGSYSIEVGGMNPSGYNVTKAPRTLTGATSTSISFVMASDPGTFVSGGSVRTYSAGQGGVPCNDGDPVSINDFWADSGQSTTPELPVGYDTSVIGSLYLKVIDQQSFYLYRDAALTIPVTGTSSCSNNKCGFFTHGVLSTWNYQVHDSVFEYQNGQANSRAGYNPARGFVRAYNNVYMHDGIGPLIPGKGPNLINDNYAPIKDAMGHASGTVEIYNNTFDLYPYADDTSSYLVSWGWYGGAVLTGYLHGRMTFDFKDNIIYSKDYARGYTSISNGETITGNKNLFYGGTFAGDFGYPATPAILQSTAIPCAAPCALFADRTGGVYTLAAANEASSGGVTTLASLDMAGVSRPQNGTYAIGAYEYTGASICTITTSTLDPATVGVAYSQTLTQAGCAASSWGGFTATGACSGLSLNSTTGAITGTPTTAGTCSFTATYDTDSQPLTITVNAAPSVTSNSLAGGTVGIAYSQPIATTGGTAPVTCSGTGAPSGLAINSNCTVTGTPTTGGSYTLSVTPTDANSVSGSAHNVTLVISGGTPASGSTFSGSFSGTRR